MPNFLPVIKKESKPTIQTILDDIRNNKDKEFFQPTGTQVYIGPQGSGKTISAVKHVLDIKRRYPKSILVTNLKISGFHAIHVTGATNLNFILERIDPRKQYIYFSEISELAKVLVGVNNGKYGVIYLIDEIHLYFNALGSLNVPMYVFTEISQQRKQRKVIIGTSQLFLRLAKAFREQCDNIIVCNTFLNVFTIQKAYDGATLDETDGKLTGNHRKTGWFIHTRQIRDSFDTYQKVISGQEQYENSTPIVVEQPKHHLFGKK